MPFPKEHMDTLVFSVVPLAVCYFSDLLLSRVHGKFTSALLDNASHGLVAFTIWMAGASTASSWQERVVSATCAAAIACAMDADHFLMAGSLHLHVQFIFTRAPLSTLRVSLAGCNAFEVTAARPCTSLCRSCGSCSLRGGTSLFRGACGAVCADCRHRRSLAPNQGRLAPGPLAMAARLYSAHCLPALSSPRRHSSASLTVLSSRTHSPHNSTLFFFFPHCSLNHPQSTWTVQNIAPNSYKSSIHLTRRLNTLSPVVANHQDIRRLNTARQYI